MTGRRRPFDIEELGVADGAEAAALLGIARRLEGYAEATDAGPSSGFGDRVMAAVATERPPNPLAAGGLVASLAAAWAIVRSSARPIAVRMQAAALLVVAAVAIGSVGSVVVVGAARVLAPDVPPPSEAPIVSPSPSPSPTPSPSPSASPTATPSPTPTPTATGTETPEPTGTDDSGGNSGSGSSGSGSSGSGSGRSGSGSDDTTPQPTG